MSDEYPKRDCEFFDDYLGVCGHRKTMMLACREKICPKENEVKT